MQNSGLWNSNERRIGPRQQFDLALALMFINAEYRNYSRTNVHALLPIVFDCRDVIKVCGQLLSEEQPYMKFWASFPQILPIPASQANS